MLNGKKILSVCGAVALLLGVGMNLRHSLNDYGMGTNSLSTFALAQTSSSSGSGSSSSGSGWFWTLKETKTECLYISSTSSSGGIIVVNPGASGSISIGQEGVIAYKGIVWECYDAWNPFCSKDCRAK